MKSFTELWLVLAESHASASFIEIRRPITAARKCFLPECLADINLTFDLPFSVLFSAGASQ
jgi:hypothetical protein